MFLVYQHSCINYLLPFGTAAMVIPEPVIVARTSFNIGFVVDLAIKIAIGLVAYRVVGL
jgi:hypothetical protein